MRILFTKSNYNNVTLQRCPHNTTDQNNNIINVGSDDCKACRYCTHYNIEHCLVPKDISTNVDDWYTRYSEYGMKQFNFMELGYIDCNHGIDKGSVKLLLRKLWFKIKNIF